LAQHRPWPVLAAQDFEPRLFAFELRRLLGFEEPAWPADIGLDLNGAAAAVVGEPA
jgi:hypothetical protein